MASLSALWQQQELDVGALERDLPSVLNTLEDMIDHAGASYLQLDEFVQKIERAGHTVRRQGGRGAEWMEKHRRLWLRSICDHLRMYFPHVPLMAAVFRVLNHRLVPPKVRTVQTDAFVDHGKGDLKIISTHHAVPRGSKSLPLIVTIF